MKKSAWTVYVNVILLIINVLAMVFCLNKLEWYWQVLGYGCAGLFTVGSVITYFFNLKSISRSLFSFNVVAFIIIGVLAIFNLCGIFETFSDMEKIKQVILSAGFWGYLIYVLIQMLNVVVLPLPAFAFIFLGLGLYGPWQTFFLTYLSFVLGSIVCFFIGRVFGQKAVVWCVGEENTQKYKKAIGSKGNLLFVMMQVLPFFPDDILCMIAGLTAMKWRFFIISMVLIKPIYIAAFCFLGTGDIIPFSGWGIPVWIAIILAFALIFILFCKYQTKIEEWFRKLKQKFSRSKK